MKKVLMVLLISISLILVGCSGGAKYGENLQSVADDLLGNSADIETIVNQYSKVWSMSIKSKNAISISQMMSETGLSEEEITEYFLINNAGNISSDFSTNIHSLNAYYEGTGALEEIRTKSEEIKSRMAELNNPPSEYEKAYDELLDMYTHSEEYAEMALSPTGSLQSFNSETSQLSTDILSQYKRIEATVPSN